MGGWVVCTIGVEAMGLLWSMTPATGQRPGTRLMKRDVTTPLDVELSVLPGTVTIKGKEDLMQATNLAQCRIHRWYMGPGVQRVPIREGRLRGTLFLPPGRSVTSPTIKKTSSSTDGHMPESSANRLDNSFCCLQALVHFRV